MVPYQLKHISKKTISDEKLDYLNERRTILLMRREKPHLSEMIQQILKDQPKNQL